MESEFGEEENCKMIWIMGFGMRIKFCFAKILMET